MEEGRKGFLPSVRAMVLPEVRACAWALSPEWTYRLGLAVESGAGEQPAKGLLLRVGMLRELLGSGPRVMKTGLSHVWEVILSFFLDCWSPLGFRRSVLLPAVPFQLFPLPGQAWRGLCSLQSLLSWEKRVNPCKNNMLFKYLKK